MNVHTDDAYVGGLTTSSSNDGMTGVADTAALGTAGVSRTSTAELISVVEEDLPVGKRCVLRGGVRIYSSVIEQPVEQSIDLQEEHVRVDRLSVNRLTTEADFRTGQEQIVEVEESAKRPIMAKQARVEEVRVGKEALQKAKPNSSI